MQYGNKGRKSTHSLKAGVLAFAAKFGIPAEVRRLLGYHVASEDGSMLHYSRDAMATPLRWLSKMFGMIRAGKFKPDVTRSGRFFKDVSVDINLTDDEDIPSVNNIIRRIVPEPPEVKTEDGPVWDIPDDSEVEPDKPGQGSSESSTESDKDVARWAELARTRGPAASGSKHRMYHKRLMTIHLVSAKSDSKLACGRPITEAYLDLGPSDLVGLGYHNCTVCFGRQTLTSVA